MHFAQLRHEPRIRAQEFPFVVVRDEAGRSRVVVDHTLEPRQHPVPVAECDERPGDVTAIDSAHLRFRDQSVDDHACVGRAAQRRGCDRPVRRTGALLTRSMCERSQRLFRPVQRQSLLPRVPTPSALPHRERGPTWPRAKSRGSPSSDRENPSAEVRRRCHQRRWRCCRRQRAVATPTRTAVDPECLS